MAGQRDDAGICASCWQHRCRITWQVLCGSISDRTNGGIASGVHCCKRNTLHGFNGCCTNGCCGNCCCSKPGCKSSSNCATALVTATARRARMSMVFMVDRCVDTPLLGFDFYANDGGEESRNEVLFIATMAPSPFISAFAFF